MQTTATLKRHTRLVVRVTLNAELRALRKAYGWSLTEMARAFHLSPTSHYMNKMIRRRNPIAVRAPIEKRLRELQKDAPRKVSCTQRAPQVKIIFSRTRIPNNTTNQVVARKCRGHARWFLFPQRTQVYCNRECQKIWRQKRRSK